MKRKFKILSLTILALIAFTGCEKNGETRLIENKDYYVVGEFTYKYLDTKKRGYYIDTLEQPNSPYYYIICMGEQNTGGYSLRIKEVNIIDDKTEIIVEEIVPGENETVTTALTSPTIMVEFPKKQENLVIKNTNNEEFKYLNNY